MQSARIIQTISSAIEARGLSVLLSETVRSSEDRGKGIFAETVISRTGITSWDAVEQAADSYTRCRGAIDSKGILGSGLRPLPLHLP